MSRIVNPVVMACVAASLAACAGAQRPEDSVGEAVRVYNENLRWGRFETAALRIPTKHRSERVDEWDQRSKDLHVTDFEIVRIDQQGKDAARAQVKLSWFLESEQIVRETSALELWERKGKTWMIVDEERLRGHEMPGLPEPVEAAKPAVGAADRSPPPPESR